MGSNFIILSNNQKTGVSMDFARDSCFIKCHYCYGTKLCHQYKPYEDKTVKNLNLILTDYENFAAIANIEYAKTEHSSFWGTYTPCLRTNGIGDYIPQMYPAYKLFEFPFFTFSKNLTYLNQQAELDKFLNLNKLTSIMLSIDKDRLGNYDNIINYKKSDSRVRTCYTGMPQEYEEVRKTYSFDLFLSIRKRKEDKDLASTFPESCPCSTGASKTPDACLTCNRCRF